MKPLLKLRGNILAAIDFETTGLMPGWHEPIQVAIVPLGSQLRPLAGVAPFYRLIRPRYPDRADPGAMDVHKIPMADLLQAPDPDDVADDLVAWLRRLPLPAGKQLVPLAHPWAFEYGFCTAWLGMRLTADIFHREARCSKSTVVALQDCATVRQKTPKITGSSLQTLCRQLTVSNERPHDALWDALAEAEVYRQLITLSATYS